MSFAMTSPAVVRPGDSVVIDYQASDDGAGLSQLSFSFRNSAQIGLGVGNWGDSVATGPAEVTIPSWTPAGIYTLERVWLRDKAANSSTYNSDATVETYPRGATGPDSHDFDLGAVTFTVENPNGDTTSPEMKSFTPPPAVGFAGGTVTIDYVASDVGTYVVAAFFNYKTPTGGSIEVRADGENGIKEAPSPASAKIPSAAPTGKYTLEDITVIDRPGYRTYYGRDGTVTHTPAGTTAPSSHSLDLSAGDFTVVNPNSDTIAPELHTAARQSSDHVAPGEAVTMTFDASDVGTGLKRVEFWFISPIGSSFYVTAYGADTSSGTASDSLSATMPGGGYRLNSVEVVDKADNYTWYYRGGWVAVAPSGATAPDTKHDFDLAAFDFTLDNGTPVTTTTSTTAAPPTTSTTAAPPTSTTVAPTTTTTARPTARAAQITTGAGAGGGPHVRSFTPNGSASPTSFFAWPATFRGGVPVARGDLDGNGTDEIVAGSGPGASGFAVYGTDGRLRFTRQPFGSFKGGVNVAVGDVAGDAKPEIIVAAGPGGTPVVRVFSNTGQALGPGFMAYESSFGGGVNVAVGRVDGASKSRIVTATAGRGGPHVRAFDANGRPVGGNGFYAYAPSFTGGVFVAAADLDGDGVAEIVTGPGQGGGPHVRVFRLDGTDRYGFFAYAPAFSGGVRVAAGDLNGDGKADIVAAPGPGAAPQVRVFKADGATLTRFLAYDPAATGGTYVAIGRG